MATTILNASRLIDDFIPMLDDVYWESSNIGHKDVIYNMITVLSEEAAELHKVSVQDGDYKYEPISERIRYLPAQLVWLNENISVVIPRTKTALNTGPQLHKILTLLTEA